jgi:glutamate dehydrogenase/leucine dehydrogenase
MLRTIELSPERLALRMAEAGLRRAWVVLDAESGEHRPSHPMFDEIAEAIASSSEGRPAHEAVFFQVADTLPTLFAAFVHRSVRGQAQGGLRHWAYPRMRELLDDGLRLSRGMTRKNALAGLWWGGGKGILARPDAASSQEPHLRRALFREYGAFVSSLRGVYVTAEDAGTTPHDMEAIADATRFATCIPRARGGSANPAAMTAAGVLCAMEAALAFRELGPLAGRRIAIQGTGNVGAALIGLLLERGASVVASEIDAERGALLADAYAGYPLEIRSAEPGDDSILAEPCDVLAPAALGGVIGPKTIGSIEAAIVCGPANNPLVDEERDARTLRRRGITAVPDFLANRMGIVSCCNEHYGSVNGDPMILRHLDPEWPNGIHQTTRQVLELAESTGVTPMAAASRLADHLGEQPHPIWGHRGRQIVESLLADGWAPRHP